MAPAYRGAPEFSGAVMGKDRGMKTIQLRRYQLGDGTLETFMQWWSSRVVPIRDAYGFAIEFSYYLPDSNEIVWACSLDGDREHFLEVEARYDSSPERAEAFTHLPAGVILGKDLAFVTEADPRLVG